MTKLTQGLAAVAALLVCTSVALAQNTKGGSNRLEAAVAGLQNDNGVVRCGLYASADGFRQPGREFRGVVAKIKDRKATCVFGNVPAGTYAVAVFHAEHNEARLETGMFGKPKQGYGFSRNPSTSFGPPSFSAASFEYRGGTSVMPVNLSY
jgi:uncharacterized protein (DUF2141 family)